jgi:putative SOS response-associated peptidase YedK
LIARLHQRIPVVLAREDERAWPDPDVTAPIQAVEILARSAGVHLDAYPVSRMVDKSSTGGELLMQ